MRSLEDLTLSGGMVMPSYLLMSALSSSRAKNLSITSKFLETLDFSARDPRVSSTARIPSIRKLKITNISPPFIASFYSSISLPNCRNIEIVGTGSPVENGHVLHFSALVKPPPLAPRRGNVFSAIPSALIHTVKIRVTAEEAYIRFLGDTIGAPEKTVLTLRLGLPAEGCRLNASDRVRVLRSMEMSLAEIFKDLPGGIETLELDLDLHAASEAELGASTWNETCLQLFRAPLGASSLQRVDWALLHDVFPGLKTLRIVEDGKGALPYAFFNFLVEKSWSKLSVLELLGLHASGASIYNFPAHFWEIMKARRFEKGCNPLKSIVIGWSSDFWLWGTAMGPQFELMRTQVKALFGTEVTAKLVSSSELLRVDAGNP